MGVEGGGGRERMAVAKEKNETEKKCSGHIKISIRRMPR